MNPSGRQPWLRPALVTGAGYIVIGIVFGVLAGDAGSIQARNLWRFAAWAFSAVLFASHIAYEVVKLRHAPVAAALHAAVAVMLGTFALAAQANIHELRTAPRVRPIMPLILVIWPALTGLGSFVAALVTAAALSLLRARSSRT